MSQTEEHPESIFSSPRDELEDERVLACHRMLMYMHGLDIKAQPSLDLAVESLRRAGPEADLEAILDEMHRQLKSHGLQVPLTDGGGRPLRSAPPMRRRSMVSGGVSRASALGWLAGLFGRGRARTERRGSPS